MKQPRKNVKSILFFLLVIAFGASSYIALCPLLVRAQSNRAARSAADTFLQSYPDAVEAAEQPTALDAAALRAVDRRGRELELLCRRVSVQAGVRRLGQNAEIIKTLERQMDASALRRIDNENERLTHLAARLDTLNPENVLRRGYALIRKNEKTVSSVLQMKPGDEMRVQLRDGVIFSQVTGIEEKHEKADL